MASANASDRKKQLIGWIVGPIAFGLSYFAVQQLFFKQPSFDETMMQVASELNKNCPITVDSNTRLDNTIALPGNVFQYNYTLLGVTKAEMDPDVLRNNVEPKVVNVMRTSPDMKAFRDHKTTMNYCYKDMEGVHVLTISVTPDQYQRDTEL